MQDARKIIDPREAGRGARRRRRPRRSPLPQTGTTSQENKAYATCQDCYGIAGTNSSLSVPTMRLKTDPRPEDRSRWKPFEVGVVGIVRDDSPKHRLEHLGAVVRGKADPLVSARDGLANLPFTKAIVAAAQSGRTVELRAD